MKHLKSILAFIAVLGLGFVGGWLMSGFLPTSRQTIEAPTSQGWLLLPVTIICFLLAGILQIAIHEAGHVFFGWLTGYRFLSYRLLNLHWQRVDGKLKLFRHSLSGTAGQALMIPPQPVEGKIPYVLYNLGGGLANLITLPLCYGLAYLLPQFALLWDTLAFFGLIGALTNLIPLGKTFPNDGYNIYSIAKHPKGSLYFYAQLAVHAKMAQGVPYQDMPKDLFLIPEKEDITNPIIFSASLNWVNRLMAMEQFEEARDYLNSLAIAQQPLSQIYQVLGKVTLSYLELLCQQETRVSFDKEEWKLIEALSKSQPMAAVFCYAYHSLVDGDDKKAEQALERFTKLAKTYPYPVDYADEASRLQRFEALKETR